MDKLLCNKHRYFINNLILNLFFIFKFDKFYIYLYLICK